MSKGVHNIAFYVSPDPECSRTTQNSEISLAPSRGRILYAIYGNSTCIISHIVVTAIDKKYRNYYVSTRIIDRCKYYALYNSSKLLKSTLSLKRTPLQSALRVSVKERLQLSKDLKV